jgi:hypothetical protein
LRNADQVGGPHSLSSSWRDSQLEICTKLRYAEGLQDALLIPAMFTSFDQMKYV